MTKSELIEKITMSFGIIPHPQVEVAVNSIIEKISASLAKGKRIEIRNFGSFDIKYKSPRTVRNPKTGELFSIEGKHYANFKPGKELKDRVNASM